MRRYLIENSSEDCNRIYRELTDEQYKFLKDLFDELNAENNLYAPSINIYEVD